MDLTKKGLYRQYLLDSLPTDGSFIGNYNLIRRLCEFGRIHHDSVSDSDYWSLRNSLEEEGLVEKGRGRGGSIRRIADEPIEEDVEVSGERQVAAEVDLYDPFMDAIKSGYVPENQLKRYVIQQTAMQGRRDTGGKWTRPDVTLLAVRTYAFVPGKRLEVITFEVKPSMSTAFEGVYESLAHSVFSHRSYLAVHVPGWDGQEDLGNDRILQECTRFGIGYMIFTDPADYSSFYIMSSAKLTEPDPLEVDKFITKQISPENQEELRDWLR